MQNRPWWVIQLPPAPTPVQRRGRLAALMGGTVFAAALTATLAQWEGDRLRGYRDIAGIATACRGVTGPDIEIGKLYTKAQCDALNEEAAARHVEGVRRCTPAIEGNQLVAASALAYNIGVRGYCRSTVARRFNQGDLRGGCNAIMMWRFVGKREVRGLVNRRRHEREICLRGLPVET